MAACEAQRLNDDCAPPRNRDDGRITNPAFPAGNEAVLGHHRQDDFLAATRYGLVATWRRGRQLRRT